MNRTRAYWAWLALAALLAACSRAPAAPPSGGAQQPPQPAPSQPAQAAQPVTLRIGHGFAAEEQLWLMKARPDLTPNQGKVYNLQFTAFRANTDRLNAYQAGELDGGTITSNSAIFAAAQGLPFKLVASVSREGLTGFKTTFMVKEDSPIKGPADLTGKTIGIVDFKSSTELWARAAVKKAGLDPDRDVKYVVVPFPAMGDAVRTGKIDVGTFVQPFYTYEKQKGGLREIFDSKYGVPFEEELIMIFLHPNFIAKHPEAVRAFIQDFRKVNEYYINNTAEAKKALVEAKMVNIDANLYQQMSDWLRPRDPRVNTDALLLTVGMLLQIGWIDKPVDVQKIVDNSFHNP